jgi:hypothetical protein
VLDQLGQAVEHLTTVHVEFFVYVPEQKQELICFQSILAIFSLILRFHNRKSSSGSGLTTGPQIDFWEIKISTSLQCCGSMKFWYGSGSGDPYL